MLFTAPTANLLPIDGEVIYFPQLFSPEESSYYLQHLQQVIAWKQEPIKMFGKMVMQPRLTAWYGDPGKSYTYSGITMQPETWTPALTAIKNAVELCAGTTFNSALLNYYRDGNDSMGWHRDNEKELGLNPAIASLSFGAARKFQLRHYFDKTQTVNMLLETGSLLLMKGATQHYWEHQLPKTKKVAVPRLNITFRIIR